MICKCIHRGLTIVDVRRNVSSGDLWLRAGSFHKFKGSAYVRICVAYSIYRELCIKGANPLPLCDTSKVLKSFHVNLFVI